MAAMKSLRKQAMAEVVDAEEIDQEILNSWIDSVSSPSTAKSYKTRINFIFKLMENESLFQAIKKKEVLSIIMKRGGAASTIKGAAQVFLKLIKEYPGMLDAVGEKVYKVYEKFFQEANSEMTTGYIQKFIDQDEEDSIESFSEIKRKVYEAFPADSDQRLYIDIYEQSPVRDDHGQLEIVESVKEAKDTEKNYYVISNHTIVINAHKSQTKYGTLKFKLPKKVWSQIDTARPYVFNRGKLLSSWVHEILKEIGIDGAINTLRHAYLSEQLDGQAIRDPKIRKELFTKMAHSQSAQLGYIRKLKVVEAEK